MTSDIKVLPKTTFLLFISIVMMTCRYSDVRSEQRDPEPEGSKVPGMTTAFSMNAGAVVRGDTTARKIALVFTGDEFGDGGKIILKALDENKVKGSFFLTGNFYRNEEYSGLIRKLRDHGNYLGSHSDRHLLYCDWGKRDSLLVSRNEFIRDLNNSYLELKKFKIQKSQAHFFMPPYEWYNDSISEWTSKFGLQLVNFTPGTLSNADYTYPGMENRYVDSKSIYSSIMKFEKNSSCGLSGFILLIHIGTDPRRTDKFYYLLSDLLAELRSKGYQFVRIDELLD